MRANKEKYTNAIKAACNEMRLDYFPQVEASELLYRVITLEDIYLPLSLGASAYEPSTNDRDYSNIDVEELIRRIDEKIAALEAEENRLNALASQSSSDDSSDYIDSQYDPGLVLGSGLRLLIQASPGSGKTTFCKRLVLAILNDDDSFFEKYAEENNLFFNSESLPVLISCKNIAELSESELKELEFTHILFKLCVISFGSHFSEISESEFVELVDSFESKSLLLILDGWDEILNTEKEALFCERLNQYIVQHPQIDSLVTIRSTYPTPELIEPYSEKYVIRPLYDDDIREFCKKWCEVILDPNQQRAKNYALISEQILSSRNPQIRAMMKNPLDLSLLLTVSKNDGRLPENKAELFKEIVDLYIFWSTNKSTGTLSAKTIRIFLAYIASYFTKSNRLECVDAELLQIIKQAITDLECAFSEDYSSFEPKSIAQELSHTGILTRTYAGRAYSFSENRRGLGHRQMQEYLTAYAIIAQYSDEEYNSMSPIEIFEDKYELNQWQEVIIFSALMNNGRVRQEIVRRLICKANENPDDNYAYTNLLFELIVNGAEIKQADKHTIYETVFSKHITDQQIANINLLVTSSNRGAEDFVSYIKKKFTDSVNMGDSEYGYAVAVIESSLALQQGLSPFARARTLMQSDNDVDVVAGSKVLLIMSWCKYAGIRNSFSPYTSQYQMSSEWIDEINRLLKERRRITHLLESIREAILAGYAVFDDFFSPDAVFEACSSINDSEKASDCELILSVAPIFNSSFQQSKLVDEITREKYRQKLDDEIKRKDYDKIAFSFSICSSIGCFTDSEREEKWNEINKVYYTSLKDCGDIGKARYLQIKNEYRPQKLATLMEQIEENPNRSPSEQTVLSPGLFWEREEQGDSYAVFSDGQEKIRFDFPENGLTQDAKGFLDGVLMVSIAMNNNLAYLLRRQELKATTLKSTPPTAIIPEQLLEDGIRIYDEFSIINYALCLSGIYVNNEGDYAVGKEYLSSIKVPLRSDSRQWGSVISWWMNLAVQRDEYEGLAVLSWLFSLGLLSVDAIDQESRRSLSNRLQKTDRHIDDFTRFNAAILISIC